MSNILFSLRVPVFLLQLLSAPSSWSGAGGKKAGTELTEYVFWLLRLVRLQRARVAFRVVYRYRGGWDQTRGKETIARGIRLQVVSLTLSTACCSNRAGGNVGSLRSEVRLWALSRRCIYSGRWIRTSGRSSLVDRPSFSGPPGWPVASALSGFG